MILLERLLTYSGPPSTVDFYSFLRLLPTRGYYSTRRDVLSLEGL